LVQTIKDLFTLLKSISHLTMPYNGYLTDWWCFECYKYNL